MHEDRIDELVEPEATQADEDVGFRGTRRVGTLRSTSRKELRRHFGEPDGPFGKITYQWVVRFPGGTVATIYDYHKSNRHVSEDKPVDWNIGGRDSEAVELLSYLGLNAEGW